MLFGLEVTTLGLLVLAISAVFSFWLGRRYSRGWRDKRRAKEQAEARARETRQQRRARERAEGKR